MNKKKTFCTESAYAAGMITLAFGAAFMEKAGFGMSMVVAPAYLLHLKISQYLPFFSFGMAEYTLQGALIIALFLIMRQFRLSYLFSFITAVIYGFLLDAAMAAIAGLPAPLPARAAYYAGGMLLSSLGVSFMFHTYISPEAYELFVKEVSGRYRIDIHRFKTVYDCVSCLAGIVLSFAFFGLWHFEGVKAGTIFCALVNGFIISRFSKLLEDVFAFRDGLQLRRYFEA